MILDKMIIKDASQINWQRTFFHYTNRRNLDSIGKNGLEPRIGENALHVEKTPKVFFVEGEKGILALMDVWLKWLTGKIYVGKFKYWFATKIYMRIPFCIQSIPNHMTGKALQSKERRFKAYAKMKEELNNSVFLILDLKDGVDFSYHDADEVKKRYYSSFLKLLYPNDSNLNNTQVEYWNLHTYPGVIIDPNKIALLKDGVLSDVNSILIKLIEKNKEYVKKEYDFLYEYYEFVL